MDTDRYKKLIRQRQQQITNLSARVSIGTEVVELDQTKVGRLSRMDAVQMQQMGLASERRRKNELFALDSALTRIEQDEYGICIECGDGINPKRLQIDLAATLCIRCANVLEKR